MKSFKKIVALLLAVMLMVPGASLVASAATASPTKTDISTVATVSAKAVTYNGKQQTSVVTVTATNGAALTENVDYKVNYVTAKSSGTYVVTVEGMGLYEGTISCEYVIHGIAAHDVTTTIAKANTSFSSASLKKKAKTVKVTVNTKKAAKVTYTNTTKKKALKKYIKVNKNGKITLKKGMKNGTYQVTVNVSATGKYKKATRVITIKKTSKKVTIKVTKK